MAKTMETSDILDLQESQKSKERIMSDRPWLDQYDDGVPETIDYPEVPLFYFLEKSAKEYGDATCTVFKGAKITYREMNFLVDRLAAGLVSLGVQKGDRIGLFIPNTPQFVMAYFAALKVGAAVVEPQVFSPILGLSNLTSITNCG